MLSHPWLLGARRTLHRFFVHVQAGFGLIGEALAASVARGSHGPPGGDVTACSGHPGCRTGQSGLHLGLCCSLGLGRWAGRPMRMLAELGGGAALLAQWGVRVGGALAVGRELRRGLGVTLVVVLLLLLVAGQAEEEAQDGFQIPVADLLCRQTLDVDSFGCQESETGIYVLNHLRATLWAAIDVANLLIGNDLYDLGQQHAVRHVRLQVLDEPLVS